MRGVDAGVEDGHLGRPRRRDGPEGLVPADDGQRPLVVVARVRRDRLGRTRAVLLEAHDLRERGQQRHVVREGRLAELDGVHAQRWDGVGLDRADGARA